MRYSLIVLCVLFVHGCSSEPESIQELECNAIVSGSIYTKSGGGFVDRQYFMHLAITNTGDRDLFSVSVPYTVHFKDGRSENGTASWGTVDLAPAQSVTQILALLSNPDVGLSYKFYTGEVSSLELGDPEILCQPFN